MSDRVNVPKVLYIGKDSPKLTSNKYRDYEDTSLNVKYIKSEKNTQVSNFYERAGFAQIKKSDHGSDWLLALGDNVDVGPQWIKVNIIEWES